MVGQRAVIKVDIRQSVHIDVFLECLEILRNWLERSYETRRAHSARHQNCDISDVSPSINAVVSFLHKLGEQLDGLWFVGAQSIGRVPLPRELHHKASPRRTRR